ncbi:translation initiation factor IF-2 [Lapidilactobacillus wuchangensis]
MATSKQPVADKPVAKPVTKPAATQAATTKPAAKPAGKPSAHQAHDDGKTKIKITSIRREFSQDAKKAERPNGNRNSQNQNNVRHENGQNQSTNRSTDSRPNRVNNNGNRPNTGNNTRPNVNNNNGRPQNRFNSNNSNNTNNNGPRNDNNRRNDRNRNNNNNQRRNQTGVSAPRPAAANAGLRHLQQYKEQAAQTQASIKQERDDEQRRIKRQREERAEAAKKRAEQAKQPRSTAAKSNHSANGNGSTNNRNNNNNSNNNNRRPVARPAAAKPTTSAAPQAQPTAAKNDQSREEKKKVYTHNAPSRQDRNFGNNNNPGSSYNPNNRKKNKRKQRAQQRHQVKKVMPQRKDRPLPETLVYTDGMNAQDLGKLLHREPAEIVKKLFMLGVMINQNQSLDKDTIELLATDYGINAQQKVEEDLSDIDKIFNEENSNQDHLESRPPVVTIMGHVDHGKTTLLDRLRHSHVTAGEAGGITQHIGAYQVKLKNRVITFLDTPGHAAFTNMRARGADVTDIVVLVVAADDGVMPQTIEAINHAKAANAPIIVAVNKIDKPGANPNHVMEQLTEYELIPESWGGDTIFVEISAKMGTNIDELLEMILLEADILELKANPSQKAVGTVLEARLDKGKGPVASLLVQQGTLHTGDPIVVGNTFGRVRVMTNDHGRRVKDALPSEPVEITGLNDVPDAADHFAVFEDEKSARAAGEERAKRAQLVERSKSHRVTLDNLFETMKEGELKEIDVIIKADVQGSAEALAGSLQKIDVAGVRVNIIHQAVGAINESDVTLASASNAIIIGFNVRPTPQAKAQAKTENVDIRLHNVIYRAIDEIEHAMKGMLEPEYEEQVTGDLTVRELYKVSKLGTIAGCYVNNGSIQRNSGVRLIRNGIVIYDGKLASLKRFKDDAKEVGQGFECGIMIENYNDIKVDDQIEAYVMKEVPAK